MRGRTIWFKVGSVYLASTLLFLIATGLAVRNSDAAEEPASVAAPAPKSPESRQALSFAPIVKKVAPCVVTIYSTKNVRENQHNPLLNDPFFRRFFGLGEEEDPQHGHRSHPRQEQSLGSGIIVSSDGYILSNS